MSDGTGKTKFTYVAAGENGALRFSSETGPVGSPAKYVYNYDELGRLEQMIVAGTIQDSITYDSIGRDVTDVTPLGQFNTSYVGETDQVNTVTALGQSISGNPGLTTYGYLPNTGDHRLNTITYTAAPISNETLTTDDAGRVDCRTDGTGRVYSYDANSNVLSDGVNTYTWDAENRLLSITNIATSHLSSFTYDSLGRRVAITETTGGSSTKTGYLWCGASLCAAYNAGGLTIARYQPQGEVQYNGGTATPYYYATDHLGSVTSTTSATGTTLGTLATNAYGVTLSQSGTLPTFGYAGMFLHQPSGLYLTKYRAYDPYSGRWLSRDPIGEAGGINLFGYVGESPTDEVDPEGLFDSTTFGAAETGAEEGAEDGA